MVDYVESNKKFMVGSVGSLKVFCMRGTRVPMDVVMDLKAVPKPLGPGSVQVTGHSLGGGAAHCGYLMMKTLYPQIPVVCVTFGVPCAVSLEIQRAVEEPKEIVNFIDEGDYIPSITIDKYTSA